MLVAFHSPYMGWDYNNPEIAVLGVGFHSLEWLFVRIAPFVFIGGIVGAVATRKRGWTIKARNYICSNKVST